MTRATHLLGERISPSETENGLSLGVVSALSVLVT